MLCCALKRIKALGSKEGGVVLLIKGVSGLDVNM